MKPIKHDTFINICIDDVRKHITLLVNFIVVDQDACAILYI